jgi:hypothetical protein
VTGDLLDDAPPNPRATLILAHGAGAPMDSLFLARIARGLVARGVRVVRFEFPYMAARRRGERRGPDRQPILEDAWLRVIDRVGDAGSSYIGGKSLGGRIASMVADRAGVRGLVALGYPFHPPGQPERLRTAHLYELRTPALFVQGERDPFGTRDEVLGFGLPSTIRLVWLPDGDHSFKPRVRSSHTEAGNLAAAVDATAAFVDGRQGR